MEQKFSKGNGFKTTEGRAQCDSKMTTLSENWYFVLFMNSMVDTPFAWVLCVWRKGELVKCRQMNIIIYFLLLENNEKH